MTAWQEYWKLSEQHNPQFAAQSCAATYRTSFGFRDICVLLLDVGYFRLTVKIRNVVSKMIVSYQDSNYPLLPSITFHRQPELQ